MSAVQFPGALAAGHFPPPVEVTRRIHHKSGSRPDEPTVFARGLVIHLAFGAGCGALYALVAPRRLRELTATAFAGLLYGVGYRVSLPTLGLHPHSADDDRRRQATNVAGHVVYGLTLAELLRWSDPAEPVDERAAEGA